MYTSHILQFSNGKNIPAIGLGTWQSKPEEVENAVKAALKAGYRHIDCAWGYGNEKYVGNAIKESGVPREDIFITSKLWGTYHKNVKAALEDTLTKLQTDYLDLYLIHWPVALIPNEKGDSFPLRPDGTRDIDLHRKITDTWKEMEAVVSETGRGVRSIGLSNASEKVIEKVLEHATIKPAVDQLELHLYNPQLELIEYLKSKDIVPQAYSPLGSTSSPLLTDEVVVEISKKHSLSPADVLLGWLLKKDVVVLPKSVTESRIISNFTGSLKAYEQLDADDTKKLDGVAASGKQKRLISPPWGVDFGFDNWPVPAGSPKAWELGF